MYEEKSRFDLLPKLSPTALTESPVDQILEHLRTLQVTDLRDKANRVLGFYPNQLMVANYSLTSADVYRDFTQAFIEYY